MFDLKSVESEILNFWAKNKIYEKAKALRKKGRPFYFSDGPPYATGSLHMGTAFNRILKDTYQRYLRMNGFDVWDQPGFDCHGLPIEKKVEERLGIKSKADIERLGIADFIKKCKEFATEFIDTMNKQCVNLGVWMNLAKPYLTLDNEYIEGAWFTFKKAHEKGLLYKGIFPVHVCTRCETVLAYNEIEYTTLADPSVWIKFKIKDKANEFFVIWTTTPWTIPANTGIMVHPDFEYARVKVGGEKGDVLIIAKDLVETTMQKIGATNYKIIETVKGKKLENLEYEHPLKDIVPALQNLKNAHRVVLSPRFVTLEQGTGLVHTAPGHGFEDFLVGKEKGLPIVSPVKINGTFDEKAGSWLAGKYVKSRDSEILAKLKERDALLFQETVTHDYPQCWRCDTPLLQISVPEWFFKIEQMREKIRAENKKVNWIPKWAGERFDNWLQSLGDWPVSRQRYWGIPLPIWECQNKDCSAIEVIGSFDELKKKARLKSEIDFHKPAIDGVSWKCAKCDSKGEMRRVPEILDVWFDSGASTWASLGYPRNKTLFKKLWPSNFQTEGPDQIRGWWNSQLLMSIMSFGRAPFTNILYHGFVLDLHGIKMSKSRGNVVTPEQVVEKYSRDILRFYLMNSAPWDDFCFNWEDAADVGKIFTIYWNVFQFVQTYVEKKDAIKKIPKQLALEDEWIISRLNSILRDGETASSSYQMHKFVQAARDFILNDFSRTYIKLIRDRVAVGYAGKDRNTAEYALMKVLCTINKALAPVCPFLTEHIYQQIFRPIEKKESVHLCSWPKADKKSIDKKLEAQMKFVLEAIEAINAARASAKLRLRWPARQVIIMPKEKSGQEGAKKLAALVSKMANAKDVAVVPWSQRRYEGVQKLFSGGAVFLDTTRDEKLMEEAMIRELIRKVQMMRKEAGLKVMQKINLSLKGQEETLKRWASEIERGTTSKMQIGKTLGKKQDKLDFEGKTIEIGF